MILKGYLSFFIIIFLRSILHVIYTITLPLDVKAKKAIRATLAVIAKCAVTTIIQILGKITSVTSVHINNLITVL